MVRVLALVLLALLGAAPAVEALLTTVGEVAPTSAVLWVRADREGEVSAEWEPVGGGPAARAVVRARAADDLTGKFRIDDLKPATRYAYRVESAGRRRRGEFVTAPGPEATGPVRFLWSGDLGGGRFCRRAGAGYPIFRAMARRSPDFFLFVGDTVYADIPCRGPGVLPGADFVAASLAGFRAKHRYNRADPAVQAFFARTSVYAIWDDHEVRNDFAGQTEPLMPVGRQAFLDYWPIRPPPEEPTRLYRAFRWGRLLEVFILDTRQYRSPNSQPDGPDKTMLGAAQRRWLIERVAASTATWKVIVSSVSLSISTGRSARDSWSNASLWGVPEEGAGFATERDAILRAFRDRQVKNVVFVAADVHHPELIRHQPWPAFSFHEFIAGPLSASPGRPRPLDAGLNPDSLFAHGGVMSFGEVTIEPALLTVRLLDQEGTVLFTHALGPE